MAHPIQSGTVRVDFAGSEVGHRQAGGIANRHVVNSDTVVVGAGTTNAAAVDGKTHGLAVISRNRNKEGGVCVAKGIKLRVINSLKEGISGSVIGADKECQCIVVVIVGSSRAPCRHGHVNAQKGTITRNLNGRSDSPITVGAIQIHRQSLAADGNVTAITRIECPSRGVCSGIAFAEKTTQERPTRRLGGPVVKVLTPRHRLGTTRGGTADRHNGSDIGGGTVGFHTEGIIGVGVESSDSIGGVVYTALDNRVVSHVIDRVGCTRVGGICPSEGQAARSGLVCINREILHWAAGDCSATSESEGGLGHKVLHGARDV